MSHTIGIFATSVHWESSVFTTIENPPRWVYEFLQALDCIGESGKIRWYTRQDLEGVFKVVFAHIGERGFFDALMFFSAAVRCASEHGRFFMAFSS